MHSSLLKKKSKEGPLPTAGMDWHYATIQNIQSTEALSWISGVQGFSEFWKRETPKNGKAAL